MALILGLQQQLPVYHEPTIVVDNRDAVAGIQLIWWVDLACTLNLQKVRDVDWVTTEGVDVVALILGLGIILGLIMIPDLQVPIRVLVEPELGHRLVFVSQGRNAVELVHLRGSASAVTDGYGAVSRDEILVYVPIVGEKHALSNLVYAATDGATFGVQQGAIETSLGEQDACVGTVEVVVVQVLHHQECPPILLLRWQQELIVHGKCTIIKRSREEVRAEVIARIV